MGSKSIAGNAGHNFVGLTFWVAELLVLPVVVLVSAALSPTYSSCEFLITRLSERELSALTA